jgi:hypothetical protein
MKKLTHSQLEAFILNKVKGATIISLITETKQNKLNKGRGENAMVEAINVDPDNIVKHTKIVAMISNIGKVGFQELVNNRLLKEAVLKGKDKAQLTFEAGKRKWGEHINGSPALVGYKGSRYLVLFCVANNKPIVNYKYKGKTIDLMEARFDPYRKPERKEGQNQGTENEIIVRDYKFESIKQINMFKKHYKIIPDPT